MNIPDDAVYTKDHLWVRFEDELARIGVTEYFLKEVGRVTEIDLPEEGDHIEYETELAFITGTEMTGLDIFSPLSGEVAEANVDAHEHPRMVSDDPYDEGWLVALKDFDSDELEDTMTAEEYIAFIESLE